MRRFESRCHAGVSVSGIWSECVFTPLGSGASAVPFHRSCTSSLLVSARSFSMRAGGCVFQGCLASVNIACVTGSLYAQRRWETPTPGSSRFERAALSSSMAKISTQPSATAAEENAKTTEQQIREGVNKHADTHAHQKTRSRLDRQRQRMRSSARRRTGQPRAGGVNYGAEYFETNPEPEVDENQVMVYPGADLPPIQPKKATKFSFLAHPSQREAPDYTNNYIVPNNIPKPLVPMWASSLTSPTLGRQRIVEDNWIYLYASGGEMDTDRINAFVRWAAERMGEEIPHEVTEPSQPRGSRSPIAAMLRENVDVKLRSTYARGLYAKKAFKEGDTILIVPLEPPSTQAAACDAQQSDTEGDATNAAPLWGMLLNSETMKRHSVAAQRRGVPAYQIVADILGKRKSSFDHVPHPLFIDQVYLSLFIACERAEGVASPLYPYLSLFAPFDDEYINELHLGVLDPPTHLELKDQKMKFDHYLREIHKAWTAQYTVATAHSTAQNHESERLPPPLFQEMEWAFRVVLSRQKLLTGLREFQDPFVAESTDESRLEQLDPFARTVTRLHRFVYEKVLRAVEPERLKVNDFNPSTIACVVPFLDMLQHDPAGAGNTAYGLHLISLPQSPEQSDAQSAFPAIVLTAQEDIEEGDELTTRFTRCYSLAYTLYRFGFLPLRPREEDRREIVEALESPSVPALAGESSLAKDGAPVIKNRSEIPVMRLSH